MGVVPATAAQENLTVPLLNAVPLAGLGLDGSPGLTHCAADGVAASERRKAPASSDLT